MVIDKKTKRSLAIEAKWTEPRGQTVKAWQNEKKDRDNSELVLQSWLELIQAHTDEKPLPEDLSDVIYQTLHRAASACSEGAQPTLAYLVFRKKNTKEKECFRENLVNFWNRLGKPAGFPFYYIEIEMIPTKKHNDLDKDLPENSTAKVLAVLEVMKSSEKLFDFKSPSIQRIE